MTDDAACFGIDVELRQRPEVDELGNRAVDTGAPLRRAPVRRFDADALRADGNLELGAWPRLRGLPDGEPLAVAELHDRHPGVDRVDAEVELVQGADEVGAERGCRPLVDLARASDLLDEAVVHDRDPVAHRERLFLVVRHVDERRPELVLNSLQLELELLAQLDVKSTERLVEEECRGTIDERARQRDSLLLSTRELRRTALLVSLELDHPEHLVHSGTLLVLPELLQLEAERNVVVDRHVREERVVLEDHVHVPPVRRHVRDVVPAEQNRPLVGLLEARDHP